MTRRDPATKEGQRCQRHVERRLPVGPAGDIDQRIHQLVRRDGLTAVRIGPLHLSGLIPVTAVEDRIGERIDRVAGVDHVFGQPGAHHDPPAQNVAEQGRNRSTPLAIDQRESSKGNHRRYQSRILAAHGAAGQEADQDTRSSAARSSDPRSRGRRPIRGPRDRSKAALRHKRSPPDDRSTESKGRRSPRTRRLVPSRRCSAVAAIKTAAAGAKSATRSWPANPPHHQSPITSIAARCSISTPKGMLV